jgi:hypothetical protein
MTTNTSEPSAATGAHLAAPHDPHHERRWMALGVVVIAQSMILLDATVVNVALPSVGYWWAAGVLWAGAVICTVLIRGGTRLHHEAGQPEPLDEIVSGLI